MRKNIQQPAEDSHERIFGPYRINTRERVLRYKGEPVAIAAKAIDVLLILLSEDDRVVSKADLMDGVWPSAYVEEANLTQNVYLLRRLFRDHGSGVTIKNIPKRGYRLVVAPLAAPGRRRHAFALPLAAALACAVFIGVAYVATTLRSRPQVLAEPALTQYMLARNDQDAGTPAALLHSATLFADVIQAAPKSASGYAGLAVSDASLAYYTTDAHRRIGLQAAALSLAREAVWRDPQSAEAFAALGGAEFSIQHDARAAAKNFARSIALNPYQFDALVWYGTLLLNQGRIAQARALFVRAVGAAPHASGAVASLAWSDFIGGNYFEAIELSKQQLRAHEQPLLARLTLANAYLGSGHYRLAQGVIETLLKDDDARIQALALAVRRDALLGNVRSAHADLRSLEKASDPKTIDSWQAASIAAAHLSVGDRPAALVWLTRVHPWEHGEIARDPRFASLHRDPAFTAWVKS